MVTIVGSREPERQTRQGGRARTVPRGAAEDPYEPGAPARRGTGGGALLSPLGIQYDSDEPATPQRGHAAGPNPGGSRPTMGNRNPLRQFELPDEELQHELDLAFNHENDWLPPEGQTFEDNRVV